MSECVCLHDGEDNHIGNMCLSGPFKYLPRLHETGARKWIPIGTPQARIGDAFHILGDALEASRRGWRRYNRADIIAIEQGESYYDPHQVYEVRIR